MGNHKLVFSSNIKQQQYRTALFDIATDRTSGHVGHKYNINQQGKKKEQGN